MFTTVFLHGPLGKVFGKEHRCIAPNTASVVRYFEVNFPTFRKWILDAADRGTVFKVRHGSYHLDENELQDPIATGKNIHITPLPSGAGGNTFKIIAGIAFIGAGLIFTGGLLGLGSGQLILIGASLLLSGLMNKKTAKPADEEDKKSFVFSGATNTSSVGGRVPIVYGLMLAGSTVLSAQVRSYIVA